MRRISILLAASAALMISLASCEKVTADVNSEKSQDNEICVNASVASSVATKTVAAKDCDSSVENKLASFSLKAYFNGKAIIGTDDSFVTYTRDEAAITAKKSPYYTTTNTYYWVDAVAEGKPVTFYALAENNADITTANQFAKATTAVTNDGIKITDYTIEVDGVAASEYEYDDTNKKVTKQTGIYSEADETATAVDQNDPCVAIHAATSKELDGVNLTFYHLLSRVQIAAQAVIDDKHAIKARFLGYEFQNVGVKGSTTSNITAITETTEGDVTTIFGIDWTLASTDGTGSVRDNRFTAGADKTKNGIDITTSKFSATGYKTLAGDSWCNVIPAAVTKTKFIVKVAFYENTAEENYIATRYLTAEVTPSDDNKFVTSYAPGTQYTYNIKIVNGGGGATGGPDADLDNLQIEIASVTVKAWSSVTGGEYTFEPKTN